MVVTNNKKTQQMPEQTTVGPVGIKKKNDKKEILKEKVVNSTKQILVDKEVEALEKQIRKLSLIKSEDISTSKENQQVNEPIEKTYYIAELLKKDSKAMNLAHQLCSKAMILKSKDFNIYFIRAQINRELGETSQQLQPYTEASNDLLTALKMRPEHPEACYLLAETYIHTKQFDKALEYCNRVIKLRDDPRDYKLRIYINCLYLHHKILNLTLDSWEKIPLGMFHEEFEKMATDINADIKTVLSKDSTFDADYHINRVQELRQRYFHTDMENSGGV